MLKIYAIHGFLGAPSDWGWMQQNLQVPLEAIDTITVADPQKGLLHWGSKLNRLIGAQKQEKRILLGYSQGGRLALHALLDQPDVWAGAIIVSAHTGIKDLKERSYRLRRDLEWADRFLKDPWDQVMSDWNNQPVFQGNAPVFLRDPSQRHKSDIAKAMSGWSIGKQEDLEAEIMKLSCPILWVAGEQDMKYVEIAKKMARLHPFSYSWIAPKGAHRVPWESPELFLERVRLFVSLYFKEQVGVVF